MPRNVGSMNRAAHYAQLSRNTAQDYESFLRMYQQFQNRDEILEKDIDANKSLDFRTLMGDLESAKQAIEDAADQMRLYGDNVVQEDIVTQHLSRASDALHIFETQLDEFMDNYPEEQDEDYYKSYQEEFSKEPVLAPQVLASIGVRKSASAWIEEDLNEARKDGIDVDYRLARIIAARQLAGAVRNNRTNIDRTVLPNAQIEARAKQLLEDPLFRNFLGSLGVEEMQQNVNDSMQLLNDGPKLYLEALQGRTHGGVLEEKLEAYIKANHPDPQKLDSTLYGRYQEPVFREEDYDQEPIPGVKDAATLENQTPADDIAAARLNYNNLFSHVGLAWENDNFVDTSILESTNRVFILKENEEGLEVPTSLNDAGIRPGTPEFWQEMQKGNFYAFPAGDKNPVQLQVKYRQGLNPDFSISRPVEKEELFRKPAPEKPGIFTNMFARFSRRLRAKVDAYDRWESDQKKVIDKIEAIQKRRETLSLKERAEAASFEELKKQKRELKLKEENIGRKQQGLNQIIGVYGTKPNVPEEMLDQIDAEGKVKVTRSFKRDSVSQLLPVNDLNLSEIKVGGEALEELDFVALGMAGALEPRSSTKAFEASQKQGDPTFIQTLINLGYKEEEAISISAHNADTMFTIDLFKSNSRASMSHVLPTVQEGRKKAEDALKAYKEGDKEPLAKLIAGGINYVAEERSVHDPESPGYEEYTNYTGVMSRMTRLIDQDKDLMRLAKKNGLKVKNVEIVKGLGYINQLGNEANEAERKLAEAIKDGRHLGKEEKEKLCTTLVKAQIASSSLKTQMAEDEKKDTRWNDAYENMQKNVIERTVEQQIEWAGDRSKRELPPEGKIWDDQLENFHTGTQAMLTNPPKCLSEFGSAEGQQMLDEIAANMVANAKLADKTQAELLSLGENRRLIDTKGIGKAMQQIKNARAGNDLLIGENIIEEEIEDPVIGNNQENNISQLIQK